MKQTKKFLSVFLALLMIFSSVPLSGSLAELSLFTLEASAAEVASGECGNYLTWTLDTDYVLTISGYGDMAYYNPSYLVPWYSYREQIKEIVIEEGVTSISDHAFYETTLVESVVLPKSVERIDPYAFCGSGITSITIPYGYLEYIDEKAFYSSDKLTDIYFLGKATEWGWFEINETDNDAFLNATVHFAIEDYGYCGAEGSEEDVIWEYNNLTGVLTIYGYGNMADYVSGGAPWYSFVNEIKEIVIEAGVSIGSAAFADCSALEKVVINAYELEVAENAFENVPTIKEVYYIDELSWWNSYVTPNDALNSAEHIYTNEYYLEPTCVTNGHESGVYCIQCKEFVSGGEVLKATGVHKGGEATCNAKAVCSMCNEPYGEINPKNHKAIVKYEAKAPTLTDIGWDAYEECSNCDYTTYHELPIAEFIEGTCGENLTWKLTQAGVLTISGEGAMTDFSNEGAPWYSYRNDIKTVVVEDGVTSIGSNAFYSCSNLTDAQLSNSLTVIGESAFSNCGLTSIVIPDKVEGINKRGFSCCYDLCSVTINGNLRYIGNGAFKECGKLTDINLPASLESIDSYAFEYCYMLAEVVLPEHLQFIGEKAFLNCTSLTNIVIPASITKLESGLFRRATWLESVTIPDSVTNIGTYAFSECSSLETVTIPDSVTNIGTSAFYACYSLETVYYGGSEEQWNAIEIDYDNDKLINAPHVIVNKEEIAATCTEVGYEAGEYCIKCQEYVSGGAEIPARHELVPHEAQPSTATEAGWYAYEACKNCDYSTKVEIPAWPTGTCDDSLTWVLDTNTYTLTISGTGDMTDFDKKGTPWYSYVNDIKTVVVEDGVTSIGKAAFYNCAAVTDITLSDSVTSIGDNAFYNCTNLINITIPDSVTSIGAYAFVDCTKITSITIPNGVTSIGDNTFNGCASLKSITIPNSVTNIGSYAFNMCESLNTVYYGGNESGWNAIRMYNGNYYLSNATIEFAYIEGTCGENLTWKLSKDGTLTISGEGDMADYADDASVPWSDYRIKITTVVIEDGVTDVCNYAFSYSTNLTNAEIPDSVTSIGLGAFYDCDSLQSITIPDSVTGIGDYAFGECTGLTSVTISDNVESIGQMAFYHCENITDITIPDGVESMGNSVFGKCNALTSITVPVSVTNISYGTFYECNNLNTVYYDGNEEQWNAIEIASANDALLNVPHVIIKKEGIEPTCGTAGYESGEYCIKCHEYLSGGNEIPATGEHELVPYDAQPSTATEAGWYAYEACKNCDYSTKVEIPVWPSGTCGENLTWVLDTNTYTLIISGTGTMYEYQKPTSPILGVAMYSEAPWIKDYRNAFKTVIIDCDVESIGAYAFSDCGLTSAVIGNGVTSIGNCAFYNCTGLADINIPDGVTSIGESVFYNCKSLTNITMPDSVTSIGESLFANCSKLTSANLSDSITVIHDSMFIACGNLTSITIPEGVTSIGITAFKNCTSLTSVTVPASVTDIGKNAFDNCSRLDTVYYGGSEEQWNNVNVVLLYDEFSIRDADHIIINKEGIEPTCISTGIEAGEYCIKCREYVSGGNEIPVNGEHTDEGICICGGVVINEINFPDVNFRDSVSRYSDSQQDGFLTADEIAATTLIELNYWGAHNLIGLEYFTNLEVLAVTGNELTFLDMRNYKQLQQLMCSGNHLTSLDLSENTSIDTFNGLDVSGQSVDIVLGCTDNGIDMSALDKNFDSAKAVVETENCCFDGNILIVHEDINAVTYNYDVGIDGITMDVTVNITREHKGGEATCNAKAICEVCGQSYGEVDANNHKGETEIRDELAATCGKDGYTGDTYCLDCGNKTADGTVIPATNEHIGGEATCNAKAICEVCGQSYGEVNANNHKDETEIRDKVDATCGKDGYTGDTYCLDCQQKIATGETINASGEHKEFIVKGRVEATYEAEGYTGDKYCKECDTLIEKGTSIPKLEKPTEPDEPDDPSDNCDHICHSESKFVQFFWKIIRFFQKLFKIEQYCDCGVQHW